MLCLLGFTQAAYAQSTHTLTMLFDQSGYSGDVWLQIQDPFYNNSTLKFVATYAAGSKSIDFSSDSGNVMISKPVKVSDIGNGGLAITYSNSAVFYIYYDDPKNESRTAAPAYMTSKLRFQPFELTMIGGNGDGGNLTAINYLTAPLSIRSYENNPLTHNAEPVLQQAGFLPTISGGSIGSQLGAASNFQAAAVIKNDQGKIVRYLGPCGFSGATPWPSFIDYTKAINKANQDTKIQNTNQFNWPPPDQSPVYVFGTDNMVAKASANGTITITGDITASAIGDIKDGNPALPIGGRWTGATITLDATNINGFNFAIYGETRNSAAVSFTGSAWTNFQTFCKTTWKDPNNKVTGTTLNDLPVNAYNGTLDLLIGDITTGLNCGYFNSDYYVTTKSAYIKNLPSKDWWTIKPITAFSQVQSNPAYYNRYADVISRTSGNMVYGMPYSDRFGLVLINTVSYGGKSVNYWNLGIGAPVLPNLIQPGTILLLLQED
jgi:hypothetical protein